ncbi:hypothetical protein HK101_007352, partial [Irineochytrium annulatum]
PKPKAKVGRKRKERPNDSAALLAELDLKRQRNTEAARRSRVRKLAEQEALMQRVKEAEEREKAVEERLKRANELLRKAGLETV